MKKFSLIILLSFTVLFLFSCKDNETGPDDTSTDGYKINIYTWSSENSEYTVVQSDTFSIRLRIPIGVTSPKVFGDCELVCNIYEYDINGNKVHLFEDHATVTKEDAISEFCCFSTYRPYSEGERIIEVIIKGTEEIKLTRNIYFIDEE